MLAAEFGTGEVLWSMFWFFVFLMWFWLAILVILDLFRSHDLGGGAKAAWVVGIILLPYVGIFIYLIARGDKMAAHAVREVEEQQAAMSGGRQ